jgi:hypothetical protein
VCLRPVWIDGRSVAWLVMHGRTCPAYPISVADGKEEFRVTCLRIAAQATITEGLSHVNCFSCLSGSDLERIARSGAASAHGGSPAGAGCAASPEDSRQTDRVAAADRAAMDDRGVDADVHPIVLGSSPEDS